MIRRPPRSTSAATLLPDPTLFRSLWLLYLPLLVPQVAFLSGITVVSVYFSAAPAWWLVMLGHLLFVLPYVFLTLSEAYRRLDPRWSHVAHALGASANAVFWRVRLPLLLAPILTAVALGDRKSTRLNSSH